MCVHLLGDFKLEEKLFLCIVKEISEGLGVLKLNKLRSLFNQRDSKLSCIKCFYHKIQVHIRLWFIDTGIVRVEYFIVALSWYYLTLLCSGNICNDTWAVYEELNCFFSFYLCLQVNSLPFSYFLGYYLVKIKVHYFISIFLSLLTKVEISLSTLFCL